MLFRSELTSNYSGNIVDICPVGALLNRDYRFKARSWFLSATPSTCTGCSRGCSIWADSMGQDTHRYRPRENDAINKSWMCDQGRLSYKGLTKGRVTLARVGRGAEARDASRDDAVKAAAAALKPHAKSKGLFVMVSPVASNEDLMAGLTVAKDVLGVSRVYVSGRPAGAADHYLMTADKNPNRKGLEWIAKGLGLALGTAEELGQALQKGQVKALWAIGADVPVDAQAMADALSRVEQVVIQATNESPLLAAATVLLPAARRDEDGYFWVIGRVDDVINVSGHRLSTAEVESAIVSHGKVAESAVIGQQDEDTGQSICAFVTLEGDLEGGDELIEEIREKVAKRIGKFARPKRIIWADDLPKTRSGKIMRRLLRDIAEGRELGDVTTLRDPAVMEQLEEKVEEIRAQED